MGPGGGDAPNNYMGPRVRAIDGNVIMGWPVH